MIKEYIIRIEDATTRQEKQILKSCRAIAKKYSGEFYTYWMATDKRQGQLTITERKYDRNVALMDDRVQR